MEFWLAVIGWGLLLGYFFSMFAKPDWHFNYDKRVPKLSAVSTWWWNSGYPESLFIGVRWLIATGIVFTIFRFFIRVYQNS